MKNKEIELKGKKHRSTTFKVKKKNILSNLNKVNIGGTKSYIASTVASNVDEKGKKDYLIDISTSLIIRLNPDDFRNTKEAEREAEDLAEKEFSKTLSLSVDDFKFEFSGNTD